MALQATNAPDRLASLASLGKESLSNVYHRVRSRQPLAPFILDALDAPLASLAGMPSACPLTEGDVIELHGSPASGKSTLIEYILLPLLAPPQALLDLRLPTVSSTFPHPVFVPMGGRGLSVLFLDTDMRLDLVRLHSRLVAHAVRCVATAYPSLSPQDAAVRQWAHDQAFTSLSQLHVTYVTNHMELLATLHLLTTEPTSQSRSLPSFLVIDSLSSLLWPLKLAIPRADYLDLAQLLARHFARLRTLGVTSIVTTWERQWLAPLPHQQADPAGIASMVLGDVPVGQKVDAEARDRLGRHLSASVGARFLVRRAPPVAHVDAEEEHAGGDAEDATYIAVQMIHPVVKPGRWVVVTAEGVCDYQGEADKDDG